jgi:nucleoside-diphosphate-sugar epimerase
MSGVYSGIGFLYVIRRQYMKILVTGHKGYIGSALFSRLESNFDPERPELLGVDRYDDCNSDLCKASTWKMIRAFRPDIIFNCAGISGKANAGKVSDEALIATNSLVPVRLRWACPEALLVQFGTCSCFDPHFDQDPYAESKYRAEEMLKGLLNKQHPGGLVLLRLGTVYGIGLEHMRWDLPVHKMARDAWQRRRISIPAERMDRPWVCLSRVVDFCSEIVRSFRDGFTFKQTTRTAAVVPLVDCNQTLHQVARIIQQAARGNGNLVEIVREASEDTRNYSVPGDRGFSWTTAVQIYKEAGETWRL